MLKPCCGWAERLSMESGMKKAWRRAGLKLGVGLALVAALIGIRMITARREGVESGIAELERLESELAAEPISGTSAPVADGKSTEAPGDADGSIVSRLGAGILGSDSRPHDGDRLVSCRLDGATRFMRADDCALRGGDATGLETPH